MLLIEKRDGSNVSFNPKKIQDRIKKASKSMKVNPDEIFIKVIISMPTDGVVKTRDLDNLVAEIAASYTGNHYDYSRLASNVAINSFHKETDESFYNVMKHLNEEGIVSDEMMKIIDVYGQENIQKELVMERDQLFDYFGWKSLQETYLLKNHKGIVVERPQHMYMRVALWVTKSLTEAIDYYQFLSQQLISCATPIMINAGTKNPQLSSCVLHFNNSDSREGLLSTLNDISSYSADAAGIGLCLSNIRSKESKISKTGGNAGGLLKYLKVVNESLRFFNQQGRRPGAAAIYIEPWHKDIFDLLDIKKNSGKEELRARDIFTALWIPDNFMQAVESDSDYYLFCPNDIKKAGLKEFYNIYGEEFVEEYNKAISLGLGKPVKAQEIWKKVIESQIETGVPYLLSKDAANKKSNQKNIGTIKSSNLCAEILEVSDGDNYTAICTLSSLVLKNFVEGKTFNFKRLEAATRKIVGALNKVIDINHYTTEKGKKGGLSQRAIGIGVQGLADVFLMMDYAFVSEDSKKLNKDIFETIYFAAISESMNLVKTGEYKKYEFFDGSPYSKGEFQFNMWGVDESQLSGMYDWTGLRENVINYGICNSLFTAQMPVAGSAKITSSYEMTEPITSNLFSRRVTGGEFIISNPYLISDLEELGIWTEELKNEILINNGSIQNINFNRYLDPESKGYDKKVKRIEFLLLKYKTIWEISQRDLINMCADRGLFIDQSQSMNIYMKDPTFSKLTSSHFHAWKSGLKTLVYYTRTKAVSTGAKHLATDMTKLEAAPISSVIKMTEPEVSENLNMTDDDGFECFGCSA